MLILYIYSEPRIGLKQGVEVARAFIVIRTVVRSGFLQLVLRTPSPWLCSALLLKQQVVKYTSCFAMARSAPPKYLLLWWCLRGRSLPLFGIVQELCESRGGRSGLSVLTSLLVSVDVKNY